ncbi:DUF309 domain-containing protein [uncultured Mycolicibacterium sp.]|uniref:DUF309 domain-containing protein n=1 Tax=uncultured Mycolicibacterium sp. TaxID=2320817 RepID=UPI00260743F5|nr:DUF309 domain-containing protein [uncultured Mycolicibacterium sp.]
MTTRDRDETGRPRNRRPRDATGRPLPHGSPGVPGVPEDLELDGPRTVAYAQDLLDRGLAFNAHEVFEAAWKRGPADERDLWQGLAQLAVGITHIQRGNPRGAVAVLERARTRLRGNDVADRYGIDAAGLSRFADMLIDDLAVGVEVMADRLRPRLSRC